MDRLRHHHLTGVASGIVLFYAAATATSYYALWRTLASHSAVLLAAGLSGRVIVGLLLTPLLGALEDRWPRMARTNAFLGTLLLAAAGLPWGGRGVGLVVASILPIAAARVITQSTPRLLSVDPVLSISTGYFTDLGKLAAALFLVGIALHPGVLTPLTFGLAIASLLSMSRAHYALHPDRGSPAASESPLLAWGPRTWLIYAALLGLPALSGFTLDLIVSWAAAGEGTWLLAAAAGSASIAALLGTYVVQRREHFALRHIARWQLVFYLGGTLIAFAGPVGAILGAGVVGLGAAAYWQPVRAMIWRRAPQALRGRIWAVATVAPGAVGIVGQNLLAAAYARFGITSVRLVVPLVAGALALPSVVYLRRHLRVEVEAGLTGPGPSEAT